MVIALCIVAHIAADFAAVPVSIRFLRSTGGLRGPRPPLSALLDKRGRKSFGWRKRWHLKVLLLTYDSSRVTPFWRCPLFPRKVSYKVLKVPKKYRFALKEQQLFWNTMLSCIKRWLCQALRWSKWASISHEFLHEKEENKCYRTSSSSREVQHP